MKDPNAGQPLPARERIEKLHGLYCALTGRRLRLDMERERQWWEWLARGFTPDDLALVIRHLRAAVDRGERNPGCLKFHNLIGQPDYFEEDLAEILARARRDPTPAREVKTGNTSRLIADPERDTSQSAADVLRRLAKGLRAVIAENGEDHHHGDQASETSPAGGGAERRPATGL